MSRSELPLGQLGHRQMCITRKQVETTQRRREAYTDQRRQRCFLGSVRRRTKICFEPSISVRLIISRKRGSLTRGKTVRKNADVILLHYSD